MRGGLRLAACGLVVGSMASVATYSQTRTSSTGSTGSTRSTAVIYEGARLIIGDTSAPIDSGAFVVQNGRITRWAERVR